MSVDIGSLNRHVVPPTVRYRTRRKLGCTCLMDSGADDPSIGDSVDRPAVCGVPHRQVSRCRAALMWCWA